MAQAQGQALPGFSQMGPPQGPPQMAPPQGPPQMAPPQGPPQMAPPQGPPQMAPPQMAPPQGPPQMVPPQGYPQMAPPQGPPQGYPQMVPPQGYPPMGPSYGYPQMAPYQGIPFGSPEGILLGLIQEIIQRPLDRHNYVHSGGNHRFHPYGNPSRNGSSRPEVSKNSANLETLAGISQLREKLPAGPRGEGVPRVTELNTKMIADQNKYLEGLHENMKSNHRIFHSMNESLKSFSNEKDKIISMQVETILEKTKELEEKQKLLDQKTKELEEKQKALNESENTCKLQKRMIYHINNLYYRDTGKFPQSDALLVEMNPDSKQIRMYFGKDLERKNEKRKKEKEKEKEKENDCEISVLMEGSVQKSV